MQHLDLFIKEAIDALFSSLQTDVCLRAFFRFLQNHLPIKEITLSKTYVPFAHTLRIGWVNTDGVTTVWRTLPISEEQRRLGMYITTNYPEDYTHRHMALDDQDLVFQYLAKIPESRLQPPLFLLRLYKDGLIVGGAVFQCTRPLSENEIELLCALEGALCLAMNNFIQFKELAELKDQLVQENEYLGSQLAALKDEDTVGEKGALADVFHKARMAATVDTPVLISGEPGVGKKRLARIIHEMSSRSDGPFIEVNCGAMLPTLMESEMFGHVKGTFPGAFGNYKGRFEMADGGTLFLNKIDELPLDMQGRMVQFLETLIVEKRGGSIPVKVNTRIIASSYRHLPRMVRNGLFREDLYYRLQIITIPVPPLRERRQDIPNLVHLLLRKAAARYGMDIPQISRAEMDTLMHYNWPENIRQLQAVLEEALLCCNGKNLHVNLNEKVTAPSSTVTNPSSLPDMDQAMREYLTRCLQRTHGKVEGKNGSARIAGLTPSTFRFRCKKLGLYPKDFA